MGILGSDSTTREKGGHTETSWGAPWYNKDEVAGQDVYLVAIYRQRHWKVAVSLLPLSRTTICPSCFTTATMEMAIKTLGETTHGFYRSIPRKDDPGCCWLPLKVDRGLSYCFRYIQHSYWVVPYIVCTVWHTHTYVNDSQGSCLSCMTRFHGWQQNCQSVQTTDSI